MLELQLPQNANRKPCWNLNPLRSDQNVLEANKLTSP